LVVWREQQGRRHGFLMLETIVQARKLHW
jgi:hypothetical protein